METHAIIESTRRWIASMVIGLNLCPFARRIFEAGTLRYVVTDATDEWTLLEALGTELRTLAAAPAANIESTLLIHPRALRAFSAFNNFLGDGDQLIVSLRLRGVIQLASFHPDYQFAGSAPDAVETYTNRSPYPMLHLLREASISAVADSDTLEIPERNGATLRRLGRDAILARLRSLDDAPS